MRMGQLNTEHWRLALPLAPANGGRRSPLPDSNAAAERRRARPKSRERHHRPQIWSRDIKMIYGTRYKFKS